MKQKKILTQWLMICLALVLAGCSSLALLPKHPAMCQPTAPTIEWYTTTDDGAYYPKQSHAELLNYLQDMQDCLIDYQQ